MPLTVEEQAVLIRKYEPHLVFLFMHDFGKQYIAAPIDPDTYIRRCGLWADTGSQPPEKTDWGVSAVGHQQPNVEPGALEAEPALAGDKTRLKDALAEAMGAGASSAFLSQGGWLEDSPFEPAGINPDLPETGLVTADTHNRLGHLHYGGQLWTQRTFANDPPPFPGAEGAPAGDPFISPPRYTAEAFDRDALAAVLPGTSTLDGLPMNLSEVYFLWYHYFFPTHDETLTRCEMIALMQWLGVEVPDDPIDWGPKNFEEAVAGGFAGLSYAEGLQDLIGSLEATGAHFSLPFASYLGDFVSVAVVVSAPKEGTGGPILSPLDAPDELFEPPLFVGFGKKAYAVGETESLGTQVVQKPLTDVFSGDEIQREDLHPLVFVSPGSNQTYSGSEQAFPGAATQGGSQVVPRPRVPILPTLCEVADVDSDTTVPNTGEHKRRYRIGVTLAKIGAGLATGAGLGIVVGAAAALFEAIADTGDDTEPGLGGLENDLELIPLGDTGNFVVRSEDTRSTFGDSDENFTYWPDGTASMVVDPADPPDWFRQPALRFGVPALDDPFNHRSGKTQPEFLTVTIEALATKLAEG